MDLFSPQNPISKLLAIILIAATMTNIVIGIFLYKPKESQAFWPVAAPIISAGWDTAKGVWGILKTAYKGVEKAYEWIEKQSRRSELAQRALQGAKDFALQYLRKRVLDMMVNEIVAWIQGEKGGKPKFITDWRGFLKDTANVAGGEFIDQYLGLGVLCRPFDVDIKIALGRIPTFGDRARCTLDDIVENIEDFYNDFRVGGWDGWVRITQANNNIYGAYLLALDEKLSLEAEARETATAKASAGSGFLGEEVCVKCRVVDAGGVAARGTNETDCATYKASTIEGETFICEKKETKTPGKVAGELVSKAIGFDLDYILGADADKYLAAIATAAINRLITKGLEAMKTDTVSRSEVDEAALDYRKKLSRYQEELNDMLKNLGEQVSLEGKEALNEVIGILEITRTAKRESYNNLNSLYQCLQYDEEIPDGTLSGLSPDGTLTGLETRVNNLSSELATLTTYINQATGLRDWEPGVCLNCNIKTFGIIDDETGEEGTITAALSTNPYTCDQYESAVAKFNGEPSYNPDPLSNILGRTVNRDTDIFTYACNQQEEPPAIDFELNLKQLQEDKESAVEERDTIAGYNPDTKTTQCRLRIQDQLVDLRAERDALEPFTDEWTAVNLKIIQIENYLCGLGYDEYCSI